MAGADELDLDELLLFFEPEEDKCAKAKVCLDQHDFDDALTFCQQVLEDDPFCVQAIHWQIFALHYLGQDDQARAKLHYLMDFFPGEDESIGELIALFSDDDSVEITYLLRQANFNFDQKLFASALGNCDLALKINCFVLEAKILQARIFLALDNIEQTHCALRDLLLYYGDQRKAAYFFRDYIDEMIAKERLAEALSFFVQFKENPSRALSYVGTACSKYAEKERKSAKKITDIEAKRQKFVTAENIFLEAIDFLRDQPVFLIQAYEGLLYVYLEWSSKCKGNKIARMKSILRSVEGLGIEVPSRIYAAFVFYYCEKGKDFIKALDYLDKCYRCDPDDEKTSQATRALLSVLRLRRDQAVALKNKDKALAKLVDLVEINRIAGQTIDDTSFLASISVSQLFNYLELSRISKSYLSEMLMILQALEKLNHKRKERQAVFYLPFVYFFTQVRLDQEQANYFLKMCRKYTPKERRKLLESAYEAYQAVFGVSFEEQSC